MSVSAFPRYILESIPEALRQVANRIEHGDVQATRCVLIVETPEGQVEYMAFGAEPFSQAHAIGLCFAAAKELSP